MDRSSPGAENRDPAGETKKPSSRRNSSESHDLAKLQPSKKSPTFVETSISSKIQKEVNWLGRQSPNKMLSSGIGKAPATVRLGRVEATMEKMEKPHMFRERTSYPEDQELSLPVSLLNRSSSPDVPAHNNSNGSSAFVTPTDRRSSSDQFFTPMTQIHSTTLRDEHRSCLSTDGTPSRSTLCLDRSQKQSYIGNHQESSSYVPLNNSYLDNSGLNNEAEVIEKSINARQAKLDAGFQKIDLDSVWKSPTKKVVDELPVQMPEFSEFRQSMPSGYVPDYVKANDASRNSLPNDWDNPNPIQQQNQRLPGIVESDSDDDLLSNLQEKFAEIDMGKETDEDEQISVAVIDHDVVSSSVETAQSSQVGSQQLVEPTASLATVLGSQLAAQMQFAETVDIVNDKLDKLRELSTPLDQPEQTASETAPAVAAASSENQTDSQKNLPSPVVNRPADFIGTLSENEYSRLDNMLESIDLSDRSLPILTNAITSDDKESNVVPRLDLSELLNEAEPPSSLSEVHPAVSSPLRSVLEVQPVVASPVGSGSEKQPVVAGLEMQSGDSVSEKQAVVSSPARSQKAKVAALSSVVQQSPVAVSSPLASDRERRLDLSAHRHNLTMESVAAPAAPLPVKPVEVAAQQSDTARTAVNDRLAQAYLKRLDKLHAMEKTLSCVRFEDSTASNTSCVQDMYKDCVKVLEQQRATVNLLKDKMNSEDFVISFLEPQKRIIDLREKIILKELMFWKNNFSDRVSREKKKDEQSKPQPIRDTAIEDIVLETSFVIGESSLMSSDSRKQSLLDLAEIEMSDTLPHPSNESSFIGAEADDMNLSEGFLETLHPQELSLTQPPPVLNTADDDAVIDDVNCSVETAIFDSYNQSARNESSGRDADESNMQDDLSANISSHGSFFVEPLSPTSADTDLPAVENDDVATALNCSVETAISESYSPSVMKLSEEPNQYDDLLMDSPHEFSFSEPQPAMPMDTADDAVIETDDVTTAIDSVVETQILDKPGPSALEQMLEMLAANHEDDVTTDMSSNNASSFDPLPQMSTDDVTTAVEVPTELSSRTDDSDPALETSLNISFSGGSKRDSLERIAAFRTSYPSSPRPSLTPSPRTIMPSPIHSRRSSLESPVFLSPKSTEKAVSPMTVEAAQASLSTSNLERSSAFETQIPGLLPILGDIGLDDTWTVPEPTTRLVDPVKFRALMDAERKEKEEKAVFESYCVEMGTRQWKANVIREVCDIAWQEKTKLGYVVVPDVIMEQDTLLSMVGRTEQFATEDRNEVVDLERSRLLWMTLRVGERLWPRDETNCMPDGYRLAGEKPPANVDPAEFKTICVNEILGRESGEEAPAVKWLRHNCPEYDSWTAEKKTVISNIWNNHDHFLDSGMEAKLQILLEAIPADVTEVEELISIVKNLGWMSDETLQNSFSPLEDVSP